MNPRTSRRERSRFSTALSHLARWYPWSVEPPADLDRALSFLGTDVDAETTVRAGIVGGGVVAAGVFPVVAALAALLPALLVAAALGLALARATARAPVWIATARRTRALGAAPALVARIALRLRLEPSPERAVQFATRVGDGPLADSLDAYRRRAVGTPRSGLGAFAATWRPWFPALDRAAALLEAGAAAGPDERERSLDRALEAVLDATRNRLSKFAGDVRGPTSAAYAFGVVLPLALAGMLPAARVAGVDVGVVHVVLLYDLALPAALIAAAGWLLLRRPVAFPLPRVSRSHPDVPERRWPPFLAAVGTGVAGWALVRLLLPAWTASIASVGFGLGAGLLVRYRPVKAVRDRVRAVERGLDDALYLIGRRVAVGESVESAVEAAAEEVPGATGEMLADAVGVQRRLRVGVHDAFLGDYGALSTLPSTRARNAAAFLALAAAEGRPAGPTLVSLADQAAELGRIERDARRELATVTATLANTGAFFGPLIAGATVALAGRLARTVDGGGGLTAASGTTTAESAASTLSLAPLGLAIGAYALLLAATLTALATGLERGLDRALVGYRLGLALPAATTTFLAAYAGASLLV